MKSLRLSTLFSTLGSALRNCTKRFPITVVFVLALTVYLCCYVANRWSLLNTLFNTIGYYLSVGTLLSLSLHLWSEEVKRRSTAVAVHCIAHALLIADAAFLYYSSWDGRYIEIFIAHGAAVLAMWLSIFVLSFFRERNDIASWNFTLYTVSTFITVNVVGLVMSGGLSLLVLSFKHLFGMHIATACYTYIFILCSVLLPMLLFLGLLPKGEQKHDRRVQQSTFLNSIIRYLFLPLAGGYLLVLYLYAISILTRWELPNGWVSWLVVTLMMGCIAIVFALYPTRIEGESRMARRVTCWLPALTLPLLLLMTVGIVRRLTDYGITINRLYLATLNAWFYLVCIGLLITRARRVSWIPVSFSLLFLLTSALPVNYANITRRVLHKEVKERLTEQGEYPLPLTEEQYETLFRSLPADEAERLHSKVQYLDDWFGSKSLNDLLDERASSNHYFNSTPIQADKERLNYSQSPGTTARLPKGYVCCTLLREAPVLQGESIHDSILYIPLPYKNDILPVHIDTLRTRNGHPDLPPPLLKTRAGNVFLLSLFNVEKDVAEGNISITYEGYLYHN